MRFPVERFLNSRISLKTRVLFAKNRPEATREKMSSMPQSTLARSTSTARAATKILLGLMLVAGTAPSVQAQGQIANGTVSGSGSGPYTYSLTFGDAAGATSPVGSVWYGWYPAALYYLPGVPTSASAPLGWTASVVANSVQYFANSPAYDIMPGHSLSGFGYQAAFSPAQLAAAPLSGTAVAYSGGIESDAGYDFTVSIVPEPSAPMLLITGASALRLVSRRKLRPAC
jgi:hypothetical protein